MPECSYCGETFEEETAHLRHLEAEHAGELGTIDRRRIAALGDEDDEFPTGPVVLGGVFLIAVAVVAYVILFAGGGGAAGDGPGSMGSAHEHGTMEMVVLGEPVDFSQDQYQIAADRFHFEGGVGQVWHTHATGVTLEWAMGTLPEIEVTADSVTYQGTTYEAEDPTYEVIVEVNGEPVDPAEHVLEGVSDPNRAEQGDAVRIVVRETDAAS
jgi:hypothetical protein